jgi:uncharacterized repeat protein (TIGR03803 family)
MAAIPSAKAQMQLTVLYSFYQNGCSYGGGPYAGLVQGTDGNFYGTTNSGGDDCAPSGDGTVFMITPSGVLTNLHVFNRSDGANPYAGLIQGQNGYFYGTTVNGGPNNNSGVYFSINPTAAPGKGYTMLHGFCSQNYCADGEFPYATLVLGIGGSPFRFFGTTTRGGLGNGVYNGTLFSIDPSGYYAPMHNFCSQTGCADGEMPEGALVADASGNYYGTTYQGGNANNAGTVYVYSYGGYFQTLYNFCSLSNCTDGANPVAGLVEGTDGNLYGTTVNGGYSWPGMGSGGTVFKITPSGTLTTLYKFCSQGPSYCPDGGGPYGGLILGQDGNFYGTTEWGGTNAAGTIFEITPSGELTTLYTFCSMSGCSDGGGPFGTLVQASDGSLYGTTYYYGECSAGYACGTIFKLSVVPVAYVYPGSLTFGPQSVGTTSPPQTVTLSNTGSASLSVNSIAVAGDFAETDNCDVSVPAKGSCTINVTFTPTQTLTRTGTLTITDNSNGVPGSQQTVSLTGTGMTSAGTLSPISMSFGNQAINTTSAAKKVTLTSTGTSNLMNIGITITGANAGDFAQSNNCPSSMARGAKCTITVTFTPSILGAESATLDVNDNAANSPQTVALSGTGVPPVTLLPPSAKFGNVAIDTPSNPKNFTLKNNQPTALGISSIGFTGANAADFAASSTTCGGSLTAKSSCTISVTFTPSILGTESATLTVSENAPAPYNALTSSLTGTGVAQATVSPTSLTYSGTKVGAPSAAKNVTLKNNLLTALPVSGFTFTGADPGDFAVSSTTCGASLASKSTCNLSVTFTPTAIGKRTATMDVNDTANNGPQTVSLTGTGK